MKSNGVWWNPMEFYDDLIDSSHIQMFMVQSCLLLRGGQENQSEGTPLPSGGGGY